MKFLLLAALLFSPMVHALGQYAESKVDMRLQQVSEHVFYVQGKAGIATDNEGFISNSAAVVTEEGVVIVDSLGSPSLAIKFLQLLRKVTDRPIARVIVTHYHADHIYGLQVYKELGAEVIAPAGYQDYLDSPIAQERLEERRFSLSPWVNEQTRLVRPDRVVDSDETFTFGGIDFAIHYHGTAHSDGDLALLVKNDAVLISGDIIFEGRVPFTGGSDTAHWLKVLKNLDTIDLKALVPGHGSVAKDPNGAINLTLRYLIHVRDVMSAAVEDLVPFDEAYAAGDWSEFSDLPAFKAAHRRNAYGVYLSLEAAQF
ncbi:MAG: MBL fold metallo-hydrolase [Gammaproteobacteria bacterium]|nr:MBL fold metallo-hydrolase [Gammaproteobacteria bacterium]